MKIQKLWKRLFCRHTHAWYFYPYEQGWNHPTKGPTRIHGGGLKITACWQCGRIIDVENYRQ